jgi:hypothetical protein
MLKETLYFAWCTIDVHDACNWHYSRILKDYFLTYNYIYHFIFEIISEGRDRTRNHFIIATNIWW